MKSNGQKTGFTLVEVLLALALSFLIFSALYSVYLWSAGCFTLCGKKNRSQVAAINSSVRMTDLIRNASAIVASDTNSGKWVRLKFPDNTVATLAYTNSPDNPAKGMALGLFRTGQTNWLVRDGVTKQINETNIFYTSKSIQTNTPPVTNYMIHVKYRVSQPDSSGGQDPNDQHYAMHVRFAAGLRNSK